MYHVERNVPVPDSQRLLTIQSQHQKVKRLFRYLMATCTSTCFTTQYENITNCFSLEIDDVNIDLLYKKTVKIDGFPSQIEIADTSHESVSEIVNDHIDFLCLSLTELIIMMLKT